jgi:hypothetical protein
LIESTLTKAVRKKLDLLNTQGLKFIANTPKTIGGEILHARQRFENKNAFPSERTDADTT